MKPCKRFAASILLLCILLSTFCLPSLAAAHQESITYFSDGSYMVTTIEVTETRQTRAASGTVSGNKTRDYYNSSNQLVWSITVYGTFSFNGSSAEATDADYSYEVYSSDWSFVSGSASYSGATATASGRFKHGLLSTNATVSLTCSPSGKLS